MQGITPNLWFNDNAEEAADFYTTVFQRSRIIDVVRYGNVGAAASGMPVGTVMTVEFEAAGSNFIALNGGPQITFTPAISFFVNCETEDEIDGVWNKLADGGTVLMEFGKYPFSSKFGWLEDKYGVSWQLNLTGTTQQISPFLMFVGDQYKKAEEATEFYVSVFNEMSAGLAAGQVEIQHYGPETGEPEDAVVHADFSLGTERFMAMDSGQEHEFSFTHAISFMVSCDTQEEIDFLWDKLSEGGRTEVCGWLADKYGIAWQIVPVGMNQLMTYDDPATVERVSAALFKMTKIDIEVLKRAREGTERVA